MSINSFKINQFVSPFHEVLEGGSTIRNFYGFNPLKTGHQIPEFLHPLNETLRLGELEKETPGPVIESADIRSWDLLSGNRPLVLAFRPAVNHEAIPQLDFLEDLKSDIQVMGGSLVIVSSASIRDLNYQLKNRYGVQILSDPQHSLAEKFGLYQPDNPIGDWLSGIDGDISLPAFYVVVPTGEISYHYVDYNFRTYINSAELKQQRFVRQLLTSVYQNAQPANRRTKQAYSA